jgi:(E)-4-hydroxy-3-methyl-but-2-enyl pyrophosphate reductase
MIKIDGYKIFVARNAGLCFGVKRALKLAMDSSKKCSKPVFTLGPIIHNPQAVNMLSRKGVVPVKSICEINKGTVIIRSHGIPKNDMEFLKDKKLSVVDATCPFVKKAQNIVHNLYKNKENIMIIGDKVHPEVVALLSYAGKNALVVNSLEDVKKIKIPKQINIVCQTTQPLEKLEKIVKFLKSKKFDVKLYNTICDATKKRQDEAYDIAKKVDLVFVVGGKNSSNTTRLYEICKSVQKNTFYIETEQELKKEILKNNKNIGIVTGASTPNWIIRKIVNKLRRLAKND